MKYIKFPYVGSIYCTRL